MRSACPHIICQKWLEYYFHLGKEYFSLGKRLMKMIEFCIELMEVLHSPLFYTVWNLQWKAHNSRHKSISSVCWWWKIYWRKQHEREHSTGWKLGNFLLRRLLGVFITHLGLHCGITDVQYWIHWEFWFFFRGGGSIESFLHQKYITSMLN